MPVIQPPPYADIADSQRWQEWLRQINELLSRVSVSVNEIDDILITSVTDGEFLQWDNASSKWVNQTLGEISPVLQDIDTLGVNPGIDDFLVSTAAGVLAWESGATARASLGVVIGTDVQTQGDVLDDLNTLGAAASDGQFIVATGAGVFAYESGNTALTSLGLDTDLATLSLPASTTITTYGASLVDDADAAAARTTLELADNITAGTTAVTAATHTHAIGERYLLCDTTSNAITVNLLAAATAGDGYRLDVKVVDATNSVTIDGATTETIDGTTTKVMSVLYDNASLVCDGSNWFLLGPVS